MAITKRPNGSWLVSIYQPDKPYIRKTFKTREEARKYEVIIKGELAKVMMIFSRPLMMFLVAKYLRKIVELTVSPLKNI